MVVRLNAVLKRVQAVNIAGAVVQPHVLGGQAAKAAHRAGVAHHTEDKVALHLATVPGDGHAGAFDGPQASNALQYVGQVTKHIFKTLGRSIAHVGKGPKGGDINKGGCVEAAHVTGHGRAGDRHIGGQGHVPGKVQIFGKVVGCARRDIPQDRGIRHVHQSSDYLVEGTVSTATDDPAVVLADPRHNAGGVPGGAGGIDGGKVTLIGEGIDDVGQVGGDPPLSGVRVINKQHSFHSGSLLSIRVYLPLL